MHQKVKWFQGHLRTQKLLRTEICNSGSQNNRDKDNHLDKIINVLVHKNLQIIYFSFHTESFLSDQEKNNVITSAIKKRL